MAAAVLSSRKREASDFLDEPYALSKRLRCAAFLGGETGTPIQRLQAFFPDLDPQLIEGVPEALGNNVDDGVKSSRDTESGYSERKVESPSRETTAGSSVIENLPTDGSGWVELFVREMMGASSLDDARARASRVLELLEKSIVSRAGAGAGAGAGAAAQSFHKENEMLKEKLEALLHNNNILKRGIAVLHERQKDYDAKHQELEHLKQTVSQYREQLKTLEINNYALAMHLKQAQQNSSIPGRFGPDVF